MDGWMDEEGSKSKSLTVMCEHEQNVTPLTQHTHTHTQKGKIVKKRIKSNRLSLSGVNLKRIKEKSFQTAAKRREPATEFYILGRIM
jgi:hypothetical protein